MSLKNVNHQKRSFTWSMEKPSAKDYFLTVFIFAVCTLIGLLFQKLNFTDTNIVTIYILGVLLTSIVTDGYLCSVAGSFLSVFLFCFFLFLFYILLLAILLLLVLYVLHLCFLRLNFLL